MAEASDFQQSSSMDAPFYEDKVFFGPITEYEKEVRERFEKANKEKGILLPHFDDSIRDISEDSHYESFSTESKYDSFNDSLNIAQDLNSSDKKAALKEINASNFLSEQVNANCKKMLIDKKYLAGQFCDSLEDIHSLVSSGDKFSLSEEIEDINIVEVSRTCDDSLRNDVCVENKNFNYNEPCFDEDSLANFENEKAFDDSLDSYGPSVSHLDSLMLSKSKAHDVDSLNEKVSEENKVSKSYFESSIHVIYENSKEADGDVGNLDDCNKKSSSVSESNLYRDSLEDLSDLPNQQNTSSASSYKSISTEPSLINSSNDLNDNKPESNSPMQNTDVEDFNLIFNKSTSKKSSTTFLKPLTELTTVQNSYLNETICIDDSILPLDSDLNSGRVDINAESRNYNTKVSQNEKVTKLSLSPLDTNNPICIDDSVILSSFVSACSFLKNNFTPQSTANNNDIDSMEVDKANVETIKNSNINDTIWIDDSIIEPLDKQSGSVLDYPRDDNVLTNNTFVIDPVVSIKPLGIVDINETCIDNSFVLPFEPNTKNEIALMEDKQVKKNRRLCKNFEKEFQKLRISDVDKHYQAGISHHGSPSNPGSTMIDIVVRSPIHGCQNNSNISDNYNMRNKKENSEKLSLQSPESINERNLKVHIEVKNQFLNVISVSEEHCVSPKKVTKYIREKEDEKEFKEKDSNLEKVRLKPIDSHSQKSTPFGLCSISKKLESHTAHFSNKNKVEQNRYLEDLDVKFGKHDVSLLQALDLHDSSINVSKNESLLSRDSFMPLNLCVRERSFEKPNKMPRNESKENIPFISYKKFASKKQNTPKLQKTASLKKNKGSPLKDSCVKQQLNNFDIKKSATKIPIRKQNNAPLIQKKPKLDSNPSCNSYKPTKSPFIVPSCPSATPHKEGSEGTPKKPHHFCMVRNSISRVPKSSQKNAPKKFQNIQSPVAKYIGNPSVQIPLKTTHRYDGNLFPTNAEPSVATVKTPKMIGPSGTSTLVKSEKRF